MALNIVEVADISTFLNKTNNENANNDYIYVNKFNHSLLFSDNGSISVMSPPVLTANMNVYINSTTEEADSARIGTDEHPFVSWDEAKIFIPKNSNGYTINVYLDGDPEAAEAETISIDGYENINFYAWNNKYRYSIAISNSKNVGIFNGIYVNGIHSSTVSIGADTVSDIHGNITFIDNNTIINNIDNSKVYTVGNVFIDIDNISIINHSEVIAEKLLRNNKGKLFNINVGSSTVSISTAQMIGNITASKNSSISIDEIYNYGDRTISAYDGSGIQINNILYNSWSGEEFDVAYDLANYNSEKFYNNINARSNSRISVFSKRTSGNNVLYDNPIAIGTVTSETGSFVMLGVLKPYIVDNDGTESVVSSINFTADLVGSIFYPGISEDYTINETEYNLTVVKHETNAGRIINAASLVTETPSVVYIPEE
jgi:hypothetical protein